MSQHVANSPEEAADRLPSGNSSRPMHTAPIGAMRRDRWLFLPQTPISWCT
jgi:hypothetical protein